MNCFEKDLPHDRLTILTAIIIVIEYDLPDYDRAAIYSSLGYLMAILPSESGYNKQLEEIMTRDKIQCLFEQGYTAKKIIGLTSLCEQSA
ncbi:MAG: hypothetical protein SGI97_01310 [candidate division Zixibacteria bacterium]|nr:hypothetical protein [candidate division Zixibacteria bacterium]